ncbi:porin [Rheinheimera maricola]|uniref:Porin n=1 Tax=Rheinheimera maricola TaxID=2793282 RepID=A0ABS7X9W0_9GAMM|nr:porin [Rheinheimera maricola]MBZ9611402.1 porin [Rheinheimera maricola]
MIKKSLIALAIAGLVTPAFADTTINGFASIKAGMTMGSDEQLYGYTDELDFKNESLMALQVRSDLGEKLSVTAQMMGRGNEDFDISFEWAFLSYQLNDNTTINAGRLRAPFYKYSEYMDVGYAYDWSRVPRSVYGLGFNNIEGVSLYRTDVIGGFDSTFMAMIGGYSGTTGLGDGKLEGFYGASWELSRDWYNFRVAYYTADATLVFANESVNNLLAALTSNGQGELARGIGFDKDKGTFFGVGAGIDRENLVIVAEFNRTEVDNTFFAKRDNYFISVGYRFGSVTPYVSHEWERHDAKPEIYQPFQNLATTPLAPLYFGAVATVQSQAREADTLNIGLRYDFHPSAAFKLQYTSQKNRLTDDRLGLVVAGVDLVF